MSLELPVKPSLEHLKKQAKDLLREARRGGTAARERLSDFVSSPAPAGFKLADAQHVVAREYGFTSWSKLKERVESLGQEEDDGFAGRRCRSLGQCWGSINWDYSETDTRMGYCSQCGEFHIECGHCGQIATYSPGCAARVHLRCDGCDRCFVVGTEEGVPCEIRDCRKHLDGQLEGPLRQSDGR
jgi:hypothetical protein